jgi:hypothetical protein
MTNLEKEKQKLDQLIQARADLERELEKEINDPDPNPARIIDLRKQINESRIYSYAFRSRLMRLAKENFVNDREQAIDERTELEEQLKVAAKEYDLALRYTEEKRIAYQTIGIKLGALDNRIQNDHDAITEHDRNLKIHVANWKTQSLADQLAGDAVCDY